MSIFSNDLEMKDRGGLYLKTDDVLKGIWRLKSADIVRSVNSQYGAQKTDSLCVRGVLKEGETIKYTLIDDEDNTRLFHSKSIAFYIGIRKGELTENDRFEVIREGAAMKTRYHVNKIGDTKVVKEPVEEELPNFNEEVLTKEQQDAIN